MQLIAWGYQMNNIDQVVTKVKPKLIIISKPKVVTVAQVLPDFTHVFTAELLATAYDGSRKLLEQITEAVAANAATQAAFETGSPTASYATKKQKAFASDWWTHLTELVVGGPQGDDKALHKALDFTVKQTFDAVFHKMLTGKDLPESKDGFGHNAMQALRKATGHGDAAIFLYRLRYWWPRAKIVIDGRKWIAKTHSQWAEELGMEERSFRTAYNHLLNLSLIEARKKPFNGQTMNHVRPTEVTEKLFARLEKAPTD
ncbi:hypothetical protein [Pararhizobium qamdonense]|uniref:hypothetical protein n=1 Tax=Pararhizobium qamdonense TaxID=3031126 RepID=UPI0023E20544|nr:hypothetical protein [Pararhizobium qamdonense]